MDRKKQSFKFYKPGTENSLYLTRPIRKCESLVYGPKIIYDPFRFGKVKNLKVILKDIIYLSSKK